MKIYSMTATFGKLENQTLTLKPGLNVISAPNEWGKSTWCAFLVTMLYGLDTREKTTKTALAVKERYAPWSGAPMSGRLELQWNGKDITIERWTKGRTSMGEFRAYETESGLPVQGLTAQNCGEMLLGVEKSVFLRAGFLRLADLPVTADESLRRRLNALVTTGDETGAGEELAQKLKELKNKCRFNRTGLLPQAEAEQKELEERLQELQSLQVQAQRLQQRQLQLQQQMGALENHRQHLRYRDVLENMQRVEAAHLAAQTTAEELAKWEDACAGIASRESAVQALHRHTALQQAVASLLQEQASLPPEPAKPQIPACFSQETPEAMVARAEGEYRQYEALRASGKKLLRLWWGYGVLGAVLLVAALLLQSAGMWIGATVTLLLGALGMYGVLQNHKRKNIRQMEQIAAHYPGIAPQQWVEHAAYCAESQRQYDQAFRTVASLRRDVQSRLENAQAELSALTAGTESQQFLLQTNEVIAAHDALAEAQKAHRQAAAHADALGAMMKPVVKPESADALTLSPLETEKELEAAAFESKQLQLRLGQCLGRMDALGGESELSMRLGQVQERIARLTRTYQALELAQQTLQSATEELQRRFAPRIAEEARGLFAKLTAGRYDRLNLTQELAVHTATTDEVAVRGAQWRSDGTVDQLYLALRLVVARSLTPQAPLVLDDALVRFDDVRHSAAMSVLREEAEAKQVIVFTCQSREQEAKPE